MSGADSARTPVLFMAVANLDHQVIGLAVSRQTTCGGGFALGWSYDV